MTWSQGVHRMWGKNRIKSSRIDTLIGQSITLKGDINFTGGLHLDGNNSVLVVSESGSIEGDVTVAFAVINGEVIGNVYATQKLELSPKARVRGNVHYALLEMASGAEVNGKMVHETSKMLLEHQQDAGQAGSQAASAQAPATTEHRGEDHRSQSGTGPIVTEIKKASGH
jgi:cytoskeletal protein CcmA (bactofilin family)